MEGCGAAGVGRSTASSGGVVRDDAKQREREREREREGERERGRERGREKERTSEGETVSYTHLTLPTIYSV